MLNSKFKTEKASKKISYCAFALLAVSIAISGEPVPDTINALLYGALFAVAAYARKVWLFIVFSVLSGAAFVFDGVNSRELLKVGDREWFATALFAGAEGLFCYAYFMWAAATSRFLSIAGQENEGST